MFEEYFSPIDYDSTAFTKEQIGHAITPHTNRLPEWRDSHICIFGIAHETDEQYQHSRLKGFDQIRLELGRLVKQNEHLKIVDLGNVVPGKSKSDTEAALSDIVHQLAGEGVIPVVIGSQADLVYAHFRGFKDSVRNLELCAVSPGFELRNDSYFTRISTHEPNFLFNFTVLGYQSHLVDDQSISAFKKMFFHPVRLGLLRNRLNEIEPVLRNTDLASIDMNAVRAADNPGSESANPNGLSSEEICQIAWYSGISEKMRSFGTYAYNAEFDLRNQGAQLNAQVIWYFIDGFYNRKGDHPNLHNEFLKYRCALEENSPDIVFFKSKRTDRWWMQIPNPRSLGNKENFVLIPCTYADYQTATKGEMPERFWQALQKL